MRPHLIAALLVLAAATALLDQPTRPHERERAGTDPADWFLLQRAYPFVSIDGAKWQEGLAQARAERTNAALGTSAAGAWWQQVGPYNIGGRVTALAVVPGGTTAYLGSANGGVFRTDNAGGDWSPVFDSQGLEVFSIGALALDPGNPAVLYVGTGEANASVDSYDGYGLWKTPDGGQSWRLLGLENTARIARIAIDPQNTSRMFVAAMGTQFSTGPDRGLYRTEDGGQSWSKVLFVSDSTGACDVVVNPAHPETVYCATWERVRHYTYRRAFGPECGIWRSADHGTTWTRLATGLPAPSDNVGRIGLAIARSRPSTLYAQIMQGAALGYNGLGCYRSLDGGTTWTRQDTGTSFTNSFGGFGWYFGDMAVDPQNPDRVYCLGQYLIRSSDAGATFGVIAGGSSPTHPDLHAIWIDPANTNHVFIGSDGGFNSTTDGGGSWFKSVNLPISQFYAMAVDASNAARTMGGTQDNNTLLTQGSPTAWYSVLGGDGFQCAIDFTNPNIMFGEYQFCSYGSGLFRSTTGGGGMSAPSGFVASDRFNWSTPIVMDPRNHNVLLVGSQRVYKSTNNGVSYAIVSGDLTRNLPSTLVFSTLTTLDISPVNDSLYYAGSDDGRVSVSTTAGATWTDVTAGLPIRSITKVAADPVTAGVVYVTLSGFGQDEHLPHVYRSADNGAHWSAIAGNLPDVPANDLIVDPATPTTLYLATDVGVYVTRDLGTYWYPLGAGMPLQAVFDLALHAGSRALFAATHGRSMWKLDLNTIPAAVPPRAPATVLALSPPAPNPSRGAVRLELALARPEHVQADVCDVAGRRVATLANAAFPAGTHALRWDGRDARGARAAAGVYLVRARAGSVAVTRRVLRID
jgi:photosystem II stability/assembly factor-like uncharacterized protein